MIHQNSSLARPVSLFMHKVYGWMAASLGITAATAYGIYSQEALFQAMVRSRLLFFGLFIVQIALVIFLSARIQKMNFFPAVVSFVTYSALSGVTLSVIFAAFQLPSIAMVFGITVGMFACMALYGYFTSADLTGFGSIMIMALFGLIIAMIVNMFLASPMFDYIIAFVGVAIFTGLIAYDTQKIKYIGASLVEHGDSETKISILCALILYLDFVNLFLMLLRLLGNRRD